MLAIIAAMQNEADTLLSSAQIEQSYTEHGKRVWEGEAFGVPFLLILSGIGKSNAASAAMLALTLGADRLLGFGAAGGITAQAHIGALLCMRRAVQYDFDLSAINGTPVGTLNEYQTPYYPLDIDERFPCGTLASADKFATGKDAALLAELGADVTDMEGAAVAHVAYAAGVPCRLYKAISDNAAENSPREYAENLRIALAALRDNMPAILQGAYTNE